MAFAITWTLTDQAWQEAVAARRRHPPGDSFDQVLGPCTDLLYGNVQMSYDGEVLFPLASERAASDRHREWLRGQGVPDPPRPSDDELRHGTPLSVIDLAYQLAGILMAGFGRAPDGVRYRFSHSDDAWGIWFEKEGGRVSVRPSFSDAPPLSVPASEFVAGVEAFLAAFAAEVALRAPELFDWEAFAPLLPYLR